MHPVATPTCSTLALFSRSRPAQCEEYEFGEPVQSAYGTKYAARTLRNEAPVRATAQPFQLSEWITGLCCRRMPAIRC